MPGEQAHVAGSRLPGDIDTNSERLADSGGSPPDIRGCIRPVPAGERPEREPEAPTTAPQREPSARPLHRCEPNYRGVSMFGIPLTLPLGWIPLVLCAVWLPAQSIPSAKLRPLERSLGDLARADRPAATELVLEVLANLDYPRRSLERLRKTCADTGPKNNPRPYLERAISMLRRTTRRCAALIGDFEPEHRRRIATELAKLDANVPALRRWLGFREVDGEWLSEQAATTAERRALISAKLQEAKSLDIRIEVKPSRHALLRELYDRRGICLTWRRVRIHTIWSEARALRMLENTLRAAAFSHFLVRGSLQLPTRSSFEVVLLDSRPKYREAIYRAADRDELNKQQVEQYLELAIFPAARRASVMYSYTDNGAMSFLLCQIKGALWETYEGRPTQACLLAGHFNWVLAAMYGGKLPIVTWSELTTTYDQRAPTDSLPRRNPLRAQLRRLSSAGLVGYRSWLVQLAKSGDDPPWSRSMVDRVGKVDQEDLLKSTIVVEYLQELGPLGPLLDATQHTVGLSRADIIPSFEKALGRTLETFEEQWRGWLITDRSSLVERLVQSSQAGSMTDGTQVQTWLADVRGAAFRGSHLAKHAVVDLDPSLSAGAEKHRRYLQLHPQQANRWPGSHEQYLGQSGFSPAGAWAAAHSQIALRMPDFRAALELWMGSFYDRLALLDPGLMRVGWAFDEGLAVLDTGSLVRRLERPWIAVWPHDGMIDVPLRGTASSPEPVLGVKLTSCGYPISLQVSPNIDLDAAPRVEMVLHLGSESGPVVPCYVSSPQAPGNPHIVPDNAFCLIPREPLELGMTYFVEARFLGSKRVITWSFKT